MRLNRHAFVKLGAAGLAGRFAADARLALEAADGPAFELVQPELFAAAGAQPNCWADFNNDGHLDLFVGFKDGVANRLYRYRLSFARSVKARGNGVTEPTRIQRPLMVRVRRPRDRR